MKTILLSALCFSTLLMAGCTSSSSKTCSAPATTTKSSTYDPATDTTTIKNGGYTWYLKGNQTNVMLEASNNPLPKSAFPEPGIYLVQRGDTKTLIAKHLGLSVDQLSALNPDTNWKRLRVGQELRYSN